MVIFGEQGDQLMSTMPTLDANVQQRLYALSCKVGQTPEIVLEQALKPHDFATYFSPFAIIETETDAPIHSRKPFASE